MRLQDNAADPVQHKHMQHCAIHLSELLIMSRKAV
jgi:hypothetical protein